MSQRGSNLFAIDLATIERILGEANSKLIDKVENHLEGGRRLYTDGVSEENIEDFNSFFSTTKEIKKEVRSARLSDGRPFTAAQKVVKNWFSKPESKLKKAEDTLREKLNEYLKDKAQRSAETRKNPIPAEPIGTTYDGISIVSGQSPEPSQEGFELSTEWVVEDFNLAELNLNLLKDFFTETEIKRALKRQMQRIGPNKMQGVSYAQNVK